MDFPSLITGHLLDIIASSMNTTCFSSSPCPDVWIRLRAAHTLCKIYQAQPRSNGRKDSAGFVIAAVVIVLVGQQCLAPDYSGQTSVDNRKT